jgi:hypothetical protein
MLEAYTKAEVVQSLLRNLMGYSIKVLNVSQKSAFFRNILLV